MDRVYEAFAIGAPPPLPASPSTGYPTDGDPNTNTPPTAAGAYWHYIITEELRKVITDAGLVPSATVLQLSAAIQAMITAFASPPSTGDFKFSFKSAADPGWVIANDGTIGDAASGASTRANADCQNLFTFLWNNFSNGFCPVTGGRGANALADWNAHKVIQTGFLAGRVLGVAGSGLFLTARSIADFAGTETVTLTGRQSGIQSHQHYIGSRDSTADNSSAGSPNNAEFPRDWNYGPAGDGYGPTVLTSFAGNSAALDPTSLMQPTTFVRLMIKL
jgi:hypothetical protein